MPVRRGDTSLTVTFLVRDKHQLSAPRVPIRPVLCDDSNPDELCRECPDLRRYERTHELQHPCFCLFFSLMNKTMHNHIARSREQAFKTNYSETLQLAGLTKKFNPLTVISESSIPIEFGRVGSLVLMWCTFYILKHWHNTQHAGANNSDFAESLADESVSVAKM